ncbi:MAG: replication restart helicase PriA, partial [Chlamydiia bacterium]
FALSPPPQQCPACKSPQTLRFRGVGTEQVERQLHGVIHDLRSLRLDADTTKHKGSHEQILRQFGTGKADVLIGTQMIAKGLHFPAVTLVGILQADSSLQVPDFRAAETTFQLLTQVAGRAGRGKLPGEVIIQTNMPDQPILRLAAAQDYPAFYHEEIKSREMFGFPPYSRLARVLCSGKEEGVVASACEEIAKALRQALPPEVEIFPALPCGRAKAKDHYRYHLLIKAPRPGLVQEALHSLQTPSRVQVTVDIDPTNTFF